MSNQDLLGSFFSAQGGSNAAASLAAFMPRQRHELECKMTIVVRDDKKSGIKGPGLAAKLVSIAVMKAYQKCQTFDPVSLMQWETNSWTKIALRANSASEI